MVENEHGLGEWLDLDQQVTECGGLVPGRPLTAHGKHGGAGSHRVLGHGDDGGLVERVVRAGAHPVSGHERAADPRIGPADRFHPHLWCGVGFHDDLA